MVSGVGAGSMKIVADFPEVGGRGRTWKGCLLGACCVLDGVNVDASSCVPDCVPDCVGLESSSCVCDEEGCDAGSWVPSMADAD